jgi:deoxycytidine triphosphate deaminase
MPIKADRWIRKMALEHGMIEPFVDRQVRQGIISYGLTSYGYDLRVADEFKVFLPSLPIKTIRPYDVGYLAALLDGEGNISIVDDGKGHLYPRVTITNTNRELLARAQQLIGGGTIHSQERENPTHKTVYRLIIVRKMEVYNFLGLVYPHLVEKQQQALEALKLIKLKDREPVVDPKSFDVEMVTEVKGDFCDIPPNSFALARSVEHFRIPRNVSCLIIGKSTYARCGVIINLTPLEPEWCGYVTIEISNTTPLPARIYANEGIGQVLFLESDEECEVSYADKQGKYQGQEGIVLPRIDQEAS